MPMDMNKVHMLTLATIRMYYEAAKIAEDKGDEMEKRTQIF